jgi:hypothetical protein
MRVRILLWAVIALFCASAVFAQNVLVNGDFETNGPLNNGNNIGASVTPWVVGSGQQPNVVQVDGPGGFDYSDNGPESDASAPGAGIKQHYLDVADGSNDFYQSFTPRCDGRVEFGGAFSTRGDFAGTGKIAIRVGTGTSGAIVGVTNVVSLPAGNSKTDPWTNTSAVVPVTAGTTYSFVVSMDNNVNFDNAFVIYRTECAPEACVEVKIKDPSCDKNGTFTVSALVVNHTSTTIKYVMIAPPSGATYTVSPNIIPVTLAPNGGSTTVSVTVTGASPGQQICLEYFLQDAEGRTCCFTRQCVTLPQCSCLEMLEEKVSCDPGPAAYAYTFTFRNNTGFTIDQLFAIPSIGTLTPQLVAMNVAPGATATITLHLSGVSAGQTVCIMLNAYGAKEGQCCFVRVCIKLPRIDLACD